MALLRGFTVYISVTYTSNNNRSEKWSIFEISALESMVESLKSTRKESIFSYVTGGKPTILLRIHSFTSLFQEYWPEAHLANLKNDILHFTFKDLPDHQSRWNQPRRKKDSRISKMYRPDVLAVKISLGSVEAQIKFLYLYFRF